MQAKIAIVFAVAFVVIPGSNAYGAATTVECELRDGIEMNVSGGEISKRTIPVQEIERYPKFVLDSDNSSELLVERFKGVTFKAKIVGRSSHLITAIRSYPMSDAPIDWVTGLAVYALFPKAGFFFILEHGFGSELTTGGASIGFGVCRAPKIASD